jgi:DNA-binding transcriptional regulator PaaX
VNHSEITPPNFHHIRDGTVLTSVGAKPGATLVELVSLTGWQPHTARAALTRLRQRGFKVDLREAEGRKVYHLTQAARR